jgi:predicted ester cyclase
MKNYVSMLVIAFSCFLFSCNTKPEGGISATTQKNLDAMHGVTKTFETSDFSKLGDFIAQDAVDHSGEHGDIKGLDSMKAAFTKEAETMGDMKSEVIKELADDDYVMSWMNFTAKYKTDGKDHKAGDMISMKSIEVAKFKDGKAVEHWNFMEPGDVMKMMGSMPMPMPMAADSTKAKK